MEQNNKQEVEGARDLGEREEGEGKGGAGLGVGGNEGGVDGQETEQTYVGVGCQELGVATRKPQISGKQESSRTQQG